METYEFGTFEYGGLRAVANLLDGLPLSSPRENWNTSAGKRSDSEKRSYL